MPEYSDSNAAGGFMRLLPAMVVFGVVTGFVALAWYAYHAGTQSVKDADLLVVEADKTPIKEKPVDAGGMQFPNQDKTIFDTFGNAKQPPKVERVLPSPEEPVTPPTDTSETTGWINDKFHKDNAQSADAAKPEQVISSAPAADAAPKEQDVVTAAKKPMAAEEIVPPKEIHMAQAVPQQSDQTMGYVAPKAAENNVTAPAPLPKEEAKALVKDDSIVVETAPQPPKEELKAPAKKETTAPADDAKVVKVQLGAYRSEKEASEAWEAMQKKHDDLLGDMEPAIVKADLGAKGIYYRLRVGEFDNSADANALCKKLTAAGQQCIIPTSK